MTTKPRTALERDYRETFASSGLAMIRAQKVFPEGVTHVAREMHPFPVLIARGQGSQKWTVEGVELTDLMMGHGALLLGHSHPDVVRAVQEQVALSTHPGGSTELEIEWAEAVQRLIPSAERIRFVSSGTEAAMMAVRLARIFTGKRTLLRFQGHFHGWSDGLISEANPPYGQAEPGVQPPEFETVKPGCLDRVEQAFIRRPDLAAVILEPTGGHWGEVPLGTEFLRGLRELCTHYGALLICDEVITGFRVSPGGAQQKFGVRPDLTVLAKVLAGGLPGGAVAGRADIMDLLSAGKPGPRLRHPGTFNGNPVSAAAGIAALKVVATGEPQRLADAAACRLRCGINALIQEERLPWRAYGTFSDVHIRTNYAGPQPDDAEFIPCGGDFDELSRPHPEGLVNASRQAMLLEGVDWFGLRGVTSAAHTDEVIDATVTAFGRAVHRLRSDGWV